MSTVDSVGNDTTLLRRLRSTARTTAMTNTAPTLTPTAIPIVVPVALDLEEVATGAAVMALGVVVMFLVSYKQQYIISFIK